MRVIDADEVLNLIYDEKVIETNSNEVAFNDALEVAIQIIDTQKTVKAIPKEWIERKLAEHWYVDYDVRELLDDWEEENEKNI